MDNFFCQPGRPFFSQALEEPAPAKKRVGRGRKRKTPAAKPLAAKKRKTAAKAKPKKKVRAFCLFHFETGPWARAGDEKAGPTLARVAQLPKSGL